MSCHDIGRGLNSVVRRTARLLDEGRIDQEAAGEIFLACRKAVHWCDGNEGEATDVVQPCMCGRCLRIVAAGEGLYDLWDAQGMTWKKLRDTALVTDRLCTECFDKVIAEINPEEGMPEEQRRMIEELNAEEPERWQSLGRYAFDNNGIPWPSE